MVSEVDTIPLFFQNLTPNDLFGWRLFAPKKIEFFGIQFCFPSPANLYGALMYLIAC